MAREKIKFDKEAAFKSIIGPVHESEPLEPTEIESLEKHKMVGRPPVNRETKKRVTLALYPSLFGELQKIAYVNRQSASEIVSDLIAKYVSANADKLKEYEKIKGK